MNLTTFLHQDANAPTTISEIRRLHNQIATSDFLGLYAYATQSGAALFEMELNNNFWSETPSRWVFGIDYGRTQPQALRLLSSRPNVDIRIHDGPFVLDQEGFVPRRDFHIKMALLLDQENEQSGIVVGSGNFSSNGLRKSIEAGASVLAHGIDEIDAVIGPTLFAANLLWEQATPVGDILDTYEERWSDSFSRRIVGPHPDLGADYGLTPIFWIEAGYVTKNRGQDRPGNQIDFPRGMSRYFGFNSSLKNPHP